MSDTMIINTALFGVLFVGAFVGFTKGFLEQAIEFGGIVATFIIAVLLAGNVAEALASNMDVSYSLAIVIGFLLLLTAGIVITHILASAVGRMLRLTILRLVDRFAGAVLGLLMGMVIASLLITLTLELPLSRDFRENVAKSSMGLFLRPIAGQIYDWIVSHGSAKEFDDFFKHAPTI